MSISTEVRSAKETIATILSGPPIPLSTIQTAISLAQHPHNISAFWQRDLLGACMRLIRTRASTPDVTYELACVQLLSISLLVFLLGADVQGFVDFAVRKCKENPQENCLTLLGGHIAYMQLEGMEVTEGMVERNAGVWGISDADAEYLIVLLYEKRDVVLKTRKEDPTRWWGFTNLYYILWYRSVRAIRDPKISLQLRDLICRFGLVAPGPESNEDVLLFSIVDRIDRLPSIDLAHSRSVPVNLADTQTIVQCYVDRVTLTPGKDLPPLNYCKELLKWASLGLGYGTPALELLVPIVEASIPRVWIAIENKEEMGALHRAVIMSFLLEVFVYIKPFMQDARVKEADKTRLVKVLVDGDWMNLAGRVIMLATLDGPDPVNIDIMEKTMHMIVDKRHATRLTALELSKRWKPSPKAYSNACKDWVKTYAHIVALQGTYSPTRVLPKTYKQYIRDSELEWFQLGEALGFTRTLEQDDSRCEYARCPYGEELVANACGVCERVRYCCVECQNADWSYWLYPHRAACFSD